MNAKEFKDKITAHLISKDPYIKEADLYFAQFKDTYSIAYKPHFPESTPGDLNIDMNIWNGKITLSGNFDASIPTIKRYKNLTCFINGIEEE